MAIVLSSKNGEIILESNSVDLKITRDRKVMVRYPDKDKKEDARGNFSYIGKKIEMGYSRQEKEIWLIKLRAKVVERLQEKVSQEKRSGVPQGKEPTKEVDASEDEEVEESDGSSDDEGNSEESDDEEEPDDKEKQEK